ncbi:MAG: methionyl-tRNA formyltransferase [Flavobacteriaceae bacterium]|nr:methionyl-tRNA formyltransferase [Flavobacteriaceae bacterium]
MKDIRIVFMGTPDFAVATLNELITQKYNVVGVITAPDKPAGRGRKINQSAVKKYAVANGLPVLQPTNLKNEDFLASLKELDANLQIIVAFRMLPKAVWNMPAFGTFNLHASLLPAYRGAAPINWAIINGETSTGVTTFFIDEKIDTGAIILQKEIKIAPNETVGELHDRLMGIGCKLVCTTVKAIQEGTISTQAQPLEEEKPAPKLFPGNCKIDWTQPIDTIYNLIRGLNPYPAAWSTLSQNSEETKVQFYQVEKELESHQLAVGSILTDKKTIKIAVYNGYIIVKELKISGKRKMDAVSLLNGTKFEENAMML